MHLSLQEQSPGVSSQSLGARSGPSIDGGCIQVNPDTDAMVNSWEGPKGPWRNRQASKHMARTRRLSVDRQGNTG